MANLSSQGPFATRPYNPGLARSSGVPGVGGGIGGNNAYSSTPYGAPTVGVAGAAAGAGGLGVAGAPTAQQQREAQRLERERREAEERETLERVTDEQREEINEAFALFDLDKDNHIDYHELKVALKALGFDMAKSDLLQILQIHGIPANAIAQATSNVKAPFPGAQQQSSSQQQQQQPTFSGPTRLLLSHAAFVRVAAQRIQARDPREEILRAFELFDVDNKGRIDIVDLRRVAHELGEGLQEEELKAMIDEFDIRGEGGIGREEFVGICLGG